MILAIALQTRLLDAAERHLGPAGESVLRSTALTEMNTPFEEISYAQLPEFFAAIERQAPVAAGQEPAESLAGQLDALRDQPRQRPRDRRLAERLVAATRRQLGPAAEPFVRTVAAKLDVSLEQIDQAGLARLIDAIEAEARAFLGDEMAQGLAASIRPLQSAPASSGTATRIRGFARAHAGPGGERILNDVCRETLGIDLKALSDDRLAELAEGVRREGPRRIGAVRTSAFLDAARTAVTDPGVALRTAVFEFVTRLLGPAGPILIEDACGQHGLPVDALTYEHLMWLADALDAEASPSLQTGDAARLGDGLRAFLTGPPSYATAAPARAVG